MVPILDYFEKFYVADLIWQKDEEDQTTDVSEGWHNRSRVIVVKHHFD